VSSVWLLLIGLGSPAVGLLLGRRLTADDIGKSVQEHHDVLVALGEVTRSRRANR